MTRPYFTMNANDRRQVVQKVLDRIVTEPPGYFFYENNYEMDGKTCFGSVIDNEFRSSGSLCYLGCIVNLGSILDYTVKLDTRTGVITASNSTDKPMKRRYDTEKCNAVDSMWADRYAVLMRK